MSQHKRQQVFKPAEDEGQIQIDPPLKASEPDILDAPQSEAPKDEPVITNHAWLEITPEQQTGKHYLVTHDRQEAGVQSFWRKTRRLSHFRWVLHGSWTDRMNRDLLPQPIFYKEIQ